MKNSLIVLLALIHRCFLTTFTGCTKSTASQDPIVPTDNSMPVFAKGADVGWLTEMEAAGVKFYSTAGVQQECLALLIINPKV
jgi:arabinogalactan endo-1,4-beta-galactosidase